MKKTITFIILLVLLTPSLAPANESVSKNEYINEMLGNMYLARSSKNPTTWLNILEAELKHSRLTYEDLSSSEQEFINIRRVNCLDTPKRLLVEIRKTLVPLPLLDELDSLLLQCELSYKQADINPNELYKHEQRSYILLAIQSKNQWLATKNDVHWYQYQRYIRHGQLTETMVENFKSSSTFHK